MKNFLAMEQDFIMCLGRKTMAAAPRNGQPHRFTIFGQTKVALSSSMFPAAHEGTAKQQPLPLRPLCETKRIRWRKLK